MSDKVKTERLPLNGLAPPVHLEEQRSGRRVVYLARHTGTGMELSAPFYQVKHACGQWAFAHLSFCAHCGDGVVLDSDLAALVFPPGKERPQAPVPALGSFNNPAGRLAELSASARQGFNTDPRAAAAAQSALAILEARAKAQAGLVVAQGGPGIVAETTSPPILPADYKPAAGPPGPQGQGSAEGYDAELDEEIDRTT